MKIDEQILRAPSKGCPQCQTSLHTLETYPTKIVDILIFHRLHFHMSPDVAVSSYRQLETEFVDWNEIRISPIREIQEQVARGENSLELSVFIKDLLEFVHRDRRTVDLEFLAAENLTDIRRYLKQIRNIEPASIDLVLMLRKGHPLLPLTPLMEQLFLELGLISEKDSRDRRQKGLFEIVLGNTNRSSSSRPASSSRSTNVSSNGAGARDARDNGGASESGDGESGTESLETLYSPGGIQAFSAALSLHHLALNHARSEDPAATKAGRDKCTLSAIGATFGSRQRRSRKKATKSSGTTKNKRSTARKGTKAKRR